MCGIVGISSRDPVSEVRLQAATAGLRHRGPDGEGVFLSADARVGLGHTRLAIIDLSDAGRQPMQSADGRYTLVFNGEIYNFRELKRELQAKGVALHTRSDSEVLLQGYIRWGVGVLERLNGIFALAIYDSETRDLFLARDQLGVKPLYYCETPAGVAFASEIKALQQIIDIPPELDVAALSRYLTYLWCPGEQTPLKAVKKLEPGFAMVVRQGMVQRRWRYWALPEYAPRSGWSARDCADELAGLLSACVERQMVSDAPLGAFLSGGLDSTAVVAAARRTAPGIQCFTIDADGDDGDAADLPYARKAAEALGVDLHEIRVGPAEMCAGVADMVEILDEPLADPASLNVLFISQLARSNGIKVLLSGAGGDDLFTGYRRHALLALDPLISAAPVWLRRWPSQLLGERGGGSTLSRRLAKAADLLEQGRTERVTGSFVWGPRGAALRLLSREARAELGQEEPSDVFGQFLSHEQRLSAIEQCLLLEKRFFLGDHNLTYTDKMAMAASVEVRVPFLDLELVKFAAEVPTAWKLHNLKPKWILQQSQRGIVPDACIDRPKTGFGAPLRSWMRGGLKPLAGELLSPEAIRARGLFDPVEVERLRRADEEGRVDGAYTLLALMCIELWCRRFLDEPIRDTLAEPPRPVPVH